MAFNPFNFFKGNPKILDLMAANQPIDKLLLEEAFVSEFKRTDNQPLQKYMTYDRFQELIDCITIVNTLDPDDKNKSFKFPYMAAEILSINNPLTFKFLLQQTVFVQEMIEQQIEVQKEINSESSDRSYSSIKSSNSNSSHKDTAESKAFQESDKQNYVLRSQDDKALADHSFSSDKSICQDDFPDAKRKRTVMVKEIVSKTIKRPYQPLIFKLLEYFQSKQVIYILDGYVCKVLENLMTNRFEETLALVNKYERTNSFKKIFTHIESNSVQQFLLNFINKLAQNDQKKLIGDELTFVQFIQKMSFIPTQKILDKQLFSNQKVYMLNLYSLIIQKMTDKISNKTNFEDKKQAFTCQFMVSGHIIRKDLISSDINAIFVLIQNYHENDLCPKILYHVLKNLKNIMKLYFTIKNAIKSTTIDEELVKIGGKMLENCQDSFDRFIQIGFTYIFQDILAVENSQNYQPKYSLSTKIETLQIIGKLLKQNLYFAKKTLISLPNFSNITSLFEMHHRSSIYHNGVIGLILPYISKDSDVFTLDKFFKNQPFLVSLHSIVKYQLQVKYQNKKGPKKYYMPQMVEICLAIDKLDLQESQGLLQYKQSQQWQFIHQYVLEQQKSLGNKVLGGHRKLKQKKSIITSSKEQSLVRFKFFLEGSKFQDFDDFQNYVEGASDSQEQQQRQKKVETSMDKQPLTEQDYGKYFSDDPI